MKLLRHVLVLACLAALALAPAGCHVVFVHAQGNGQAQSDVRALAGFTAVENDSALPVNIRHGASASVTVTIDANLQSLIETTVVAGALRISSREPFDAMRGARVDVTLPALSRVDSDGSGDVTVSGFTSENPLALASDGSGALSYEGVSGALDVALSGSGSMTLRGESAHLRARCDGSGSLDAGALAVHGGADVALSGSGSAVLSVQGDATVANHGSGSIDVTLQGGNAELSVTGSGSIHWRGDATVRSTSDTGSGSIVRD